MDEHEKLLLENKAWAQEKIHHDKDYFKNLSAIQSPKFLWIGCADSRVPANEITHTEPGEIFVHRNIANMVVHTDLNMLSVLQYAVDHLEVEHVIVCGHYGCGGVKAAMTQKNYGLLNKWVRNIKDVYRRHRTELEHLTQKEKEDKLVELNVKDQVENLAETSIVQLAWAKHKRPVLHGWVYGLNDGILHDLYVMRPGAYIDPIYKLDI